MNAKQAYVLSKGYTTSSIDGLTTIKGANCTIDSITPSPDGTYNTVVFGWTGTETGQHMTSEMIVEDGRSIKSAALAADAEGKLHLIVTFDDGSTKDAGLVPVPTVEVGTTETVDYDEFAEVTSTPTESGIKLNFKIPKGQPGEADPIWISV